jgi:hypothetical protein
MTTAVHFRTAKKKARQDAFIEALYDIGILSRAAEAVGIGRQTVYDWKAEDPEFAQEMQDAITRGLFDRLMQVAFDKESRGSSSVLIFLAKTILGLSDRSGETEILRRQVADLEKERQRMRYVVFQAMKENPELRAAVSREIGEFEEND